MATSDEIFDFLKTNPQFKDEVHESLKCGLCRSVMINASFTSCGCDFCYNCISHHLKSSSETCPKCKRGISSDVTVNVSNLRRINLLLVKCNHGKCKVVDSVTNVVEHMKHCDMQMMKCPFSSVGCGNEEFAGLDKINCHCNTEVVKHNKILLNEIKNIKNTNNQNEETIKEMKGTIEELRLSEEDLKREIEKRNIESLKKIEELRISGEDLKREIENGTIESLNYKNQVDIVSAELVSLKCDYEGQLNEVSRTSINLNDENVKLKRKIEEIEKKFSEEIIEIKNEMKNDMKNEMKKKYVENNDKILKLQNDFSRQNNEIKQPIEIIEKKQDKEKVQKEKLWNGLGRVNYGDFVWKLDKFSERKKEVSEIGEQFVESNVFYSHKQGYKLKLRCYLGVGLLTEDLCLSFVILKGEFDKFLTWPLRRNIKLSLMNHETSEDDIVKYFHVDSDARFKDSYNKPTELQNKPCGYWNLMSWIELAKSPHLLKNDTISIKCCITL